jgi:DNA-binding IclR family transcriptional regulator
MDAAMPRPALSAARAVAVVNFLTANPGGSFTLTEVANELGVNRASMHAVLNVLMAEGYVVRDPARKGYRLGSSLVAVGQAALDQQPAIRRAREEASALAERLGLECLATVTVGAEFLVVGEAGRPDRLHFRPRVGQRIPFMPPLGIAAAAFLPESELTAWLDRMEPGTSDEERDAYRRAAVASRALGYEIGLETPTRELIGRVMAELVSEPRSPELHARLGELIGDLGHEEHQLLKPEVGASYRVNNISAPIFGPQRTVIAGLALLGFDQPLAAARIEEYVETLVATTTTITRSTGGRIPLRL